MGGSVVPDLASGYWELVASDSSGKGWTTSAIVFTSASTNPDGTIALEYRTDWFEGGNRKP